MRKILIIGAQNIDLFARAKADYVLHDSNISNIHIFGQKVDFLTVFADDYFSRLAKDNLKDLGIGFNESKNVPGARSSVYLGVMDKANDLYLGLNDMDIINTLDTAFFKAKTAYIESFDVLVIDNNLSLDALPFLLKTFKHKEILMDAVSAKKAVKLKGLLPFINLLKLNLMELQALSPKANTKEKLEDLLAQGLSSLILTSADQEIVYKSKSAQLITRPKPIERIENSTGAGDAFLAGYIHGFVEGKSVEECLGIAKETAYSCLQSPNSTIQKQIN
jgi:pseudouridine kinase